LITVAVGRITGLGGFHTVDGGGVAVGELDDVGTVNVGTIGGAVAVVGATVAVGAAADREVVTGVEVVTGRAADVDG
jgi:hypothetical protein